MKNRKLNLFAAAFTLPLAIGLLTNGIAGHYSFKELMSLAFGYTLGFFVLGAVIATIVSIIPIYFITKGNFRRQRLD